MALQYSTTYRNNILDQLESTLGTSPKLQVWSGTVPANCAATPGGTLLAEATLPSDWMASASGGTKTLSGTWTDSSANATGTATFFRLLDSAGTTCHLQGTYGTSGTDMIGTTSFVGGQSFSVTVFTLTAPGA